MLSAVTSWLLTFQVDSYESMLDSVLVARDRFLRPGGLVAPSQCSILLSALDGSGPDGFVTKRLNYWDDVYGKHHTFARLISAHPWDIGFKMASLKEEVYKDAFIDFVEESASISKPVVLQVRCLAL